MHDAETEIERGTGGGENYVGWKNEDFRILIENEKKLDEGVIEMVRTPKKKGEENKYHHPLEVGFEI
ncbi:class I SAM-dependent methyltransferase [Sesbania bispinosa]|nr:class I SAM-dependent methyltransferase [Sesbania bispinosa]